MGALVRSFHRSTSLTIKVILLAVILVTANAMAVMLPDKADEQAQLNVSKNTPAQSSHPYKQGELLVKLREGVVVANPKALAAKLGVSRGKNFKAPKKGGKAAEQLKRWWHVQLPPGVKVEDAMARLKKHPEVEVVEPNYEVSPQAVPNDVRFIESWGLNNTGQTGGTYDADIDAVEAWDIEYGTTNPVIVAVTDSGIDYNHDDLRDNIWTNPGEIPDNGIDDDGNGYVDDVHGYDLAWHDSDPMDDGFHGTHVAGIIGARANNSVGTSGVDPNARLMAIKTLPGYGFGSIQAGIDGIVYAIDNGAKVINASWEGPESEAEQDAVRAAYEAGVVLVASPGNNGCDTDTFPSYPANYDFPNVITVAATDHDDKLWPDSCYGATTVDLGAPGGQILSTVPSDCRLGCDSTGYAYSDGTSMSTPMVSGAAALLLSRSPSLSVDSLRKVLFESVDMLPSLAGKTVTGGRLNIYNALGMVNYGATFDPDWQEVASGNSATYTLTLTSYENYADTLTLALDTLAPGLDASLSTGSVTLSPNGTASATVTVSSTAGMSRGLYPIRVKMTDSAGKTLIAEARLRVKTSGFEIHITPESQYTGPGNSATYDVTVNSLDGYNGTVLLSTTSSDPTLATTLTNTSVTVPADGAASTVLTVTPPSNAAIQTNTLTVTATDNVTTDSDDAELNVVGADLVVTDATPSKTTVGLGESFTLDNTIANQGSSKATSVSPVYDFIRVSYVLSKDSVIDLNDVSIGTRTTGLLEAGETSTESNTVLTVPVDTEPGIYNLYVTVDGMNAILESNDNNNVLEVGQITVFSSDFDLSISSANVSSSTWYAGVANYTVNATVNNPGSTAITTSTRLQYVLSKDTSYQPNEDIWVGYEKISSLDAGGSLTLTTGLTSPEEPDTYNLLAITDFYDELTETDETNNVFVVGQVTVVSDIDLVVTAATPSKMTLTTGETFSITDTIENHGSSPVNNSSYVGYYLSGDTKVDTSDLLIGSRWIEKLSSWGSNSGSGMATIPPGLTPGEYTLGVIADNYGMVDETSDDNNVRIVGKVTINAAADLVPSSATVSSTSMLPGANFTLESTVANQGTADATNFDVVYYLSTDAVIETTDTQLDSRTVATLAAGGNSPDSRTLTLPLTLTPGKFYLGMIVDPDNRQTESSDSNNYRLIETITVVNDVDLTVTSATTAATEVYRGQSFTLDNAVANQGTMDSSQFNVGYYLSTDAEVDTSDIRIASRTITALAAGGASADNTEITIPTTFAPDTYYLGIIVDDGNTNSETSEKNNLHIIGQINVPAEVDLTLTTATPSSTSVMAGSSFSLDNTISNLGDADASSFEVAYYLSIDSTIDTTDTQIGSRTITSMAKGDTNTEVTSLMVPQTLEPKHYFLGVIVDAANSQAESNENNNVKLVGEISVEPNVDLVATDATPSSTTLDAGSTFTLDNTVANQGYSDSSYFYVFYYLSTEPDISAAKTSIGYRRIDSLSAGSVNSELTTLTVPASLSPDDYYLWVNVDTYGYVTETDETNNLRMMGQVTVQAGNTDVAVTGVNVPSTTLYQGGTYLVDGTIANQGETNLGVSVGFYLSQFPDVKTSDTKLYSASIQITAGSSYNLSHNVTLPSTLSPGIYYLGVFADDTDTYLETNEFNNSWVAPVTVAPVAEGVDLVIPSATVSSTSLYLGGSFKLDATVANYGSQYASWSYGGVYLSTDPEIDTTDALLSSFTINGLYAAEEENINPIIGYIPTTLTPQQYYLGVIIDRTNQVAETYEENNAFLIGPVTVGNADIDVAVTDLLSTNVSPGKTYHIDMTVANQGSTDDVSFSVSYYLSPDQTIMNAGDVSLGSFNVYSLPAGGEKTISWDKSFSSNITPGDYYLIARADGGDQLSETNEDNNIFVGPKITVGPWGSDLIVDDATLSDTVVTAGNSLTLNGVAFTNQGSLGTSSSFYIGYYLSQDDVIDTSDIRIYSSYSGGMSADRTYNYDAVSVVVPSSITPGNYHLGIIIDYNDSESELDENNNVFDVGMVDVQPSDIDLVVAGATLSATIVHPGESFDIYNVITNQGSTNAGTFYSSFFLSDDAEIDTSDTEIDDRGIYGLLAGASNGATNTVTVPVDMEPREYYVGVIADSRTDYNQPETDETNNVLVVGKLTVVAGNVDLTITDATPSTTSLTAGDSFTIDTTLANLGDVVSPGFVVAFYLSKNDVFSKDDIEIGYYTEGVTAGGSSTHNKTLVVPPDIQPGPYFLGVIADVNNEVTETSESNNVFNLGLVSVGVGDIDLAITTASTPATTLYTGSSFTISDTVANQGSSPLSSVVDYVLSSDPTFKSSNIVIGSRSSALDSGATSDATTTVSVPSTLIPDTYYLGVIADPNNKYAESDEINNIYMIGQVSVVMDVDLEVSAATSSTTTLTAGTSFTLDNTITNLGLSKSSSYVSAGFYLSEDADITTSDIQIDYRSVPGLDADASDSQSSTITVPVTLEPRQYYLGVIADNNNNLAESDETNNVKMIGMVTVLPPDTDLVVSSAATSDTALYPGMTFTLDNTVANQGSVPATSFFSVGYYLSSDTEVDTSDIKIGSRMVNSLAADSTNRESSSITLPSNLLPGPYTLGVIVDDGERYPESDETNNVRVVGQVSVTVATTTAWVTPPLSTMEVWTTQTLSVYVEPATGGDLQCDPVLGCGTVEFSIDGVVDIADLSFNSETSRYEASVPWVPVATGTISISAQYVGNIEYDPSSVTAIVEVVPKETETIWVSLPSFVVEGTTQTLTVSVAPTSGGPLNCDMDLGCIPTSYGKVRFMDGATILGEVDVDSGGEASLDWVPTGTGTHQLTAQYLGSAVNLLSSTTAEVSITGSIETVTGWITAPTAMEVGNSQTLSVYVDGHLKCNDPVLGCGKVQFLDGTTVLGEVDLVYVKDLKHYEAALDWVPTTAGTHTITAQYMGTSDNASSLVAATVDVTNGIDLVVTSQAAPITSLPIGAGFRIPETVWTNQGTNASSGFSVTYYLSSDATITTNDIEIGSWDSAGLSGGESGTVDGVYAPIPDTLTPGPYHLGVIVDSGDVVSESDESNNVLAIPVDLQPAFTDITGSVSSAPSTIALDGYFTVSDSVTNVGNTEEANLIVKKYYLSKDPVLSPLTDKDLGYVQSIHMLLVGETKSGTYNMPSPVTGELEPGAYYLILDVYTWGVEDNYDNNAIIAGQVTLLPSDIDIATTDASISDTALTPGQSFTVTETLSNQGTTDSSPFGVSYYLSSDAVIDVTDIYIGSDYVGSYYKGLDAGETLTQSRIFSMPGVAPGLYNVIVVADGGNIFAESDEGNNVRIAGQVTITNDADLVVTDVTPSSTTLNAGDTFSITDTVANQGTTAAYGDTYPNIYSRYYLSFDQSISADDTEIGYRRYGTIAAGGTNTATTSVTVPATMAPEKYYLIEMTDADSIVWETNENNNVKVSGSQITIQ